MNHLNDIELQALRTLVATRIVQIDNVLNANSRRLSAPDAMVQNEVNKQTAYRNALSTILNKLYRS